MKRQKFQEIAADVLHSAGSAPRRMVALHSGAVTLAFLLVAVMTFGVELIPTSGGLDSFGTQAVLLAIPTTFRVILAALLPAWGVGLRYAALCIYRGQNPEGDGLLEGFRRFVPVMVTVLWRVLRLAVAAFIALWGVSALIMLLPMPQVASELFECFLNEGTLPATWEGKLILGTYLWCYVNGIAIFILPIVYRNRLTGYLIVDDPELGGWKAMMESRLLMRRGSRRLMSLDLSYIWYHLLDAVLLVAPFVEFLPMLGVHLNIPFAAKPVMLVAAPVLRFVLHLMVKPKLAVEYAGFFDTLLYQEPEEPQPKQTPTPEKMPWKY